MSTAMEDGAHQAVLGDGEENAWCDLGARHQAVSLLPAGVQFDEVLDVRVLKVAVPYRCRVPL